MDPFRSAKRTVTCLRSPSRAAFEVRIFSARCFGVYDSGDANLTSAVGCEATGSPHSRQNFAPAGSSLRHFVQLSATRAPHSRQNFACGGFSCWHRGHFMLPLPHVLVEEGGGNVARRLNWVENALKT